MGGKSVICYKLCFENEFLETYDSTISDVYGNVTVQGFGPGSEKYIVDFTDAGGKHKSDCLDEWVEENDMFIIVYDVTTEISFIEGVRYENAIKYSKKKKGAPIIWIGNKSDLLSDDQRRMLEEKGPSKYFSTPAKVFSSLLRKADSKLKNSNTVEKVNFFEKNIMENKKSRDAKSPGNDRKCYLVSGKYDDSS